LFFLYPVFQMHTPYKSNYKTYFSLFEARIKAEKAQFTSDVDNYKKKSSLLPGSNVH